MSNLQIEMLATLIIRVGRDIAWVVKNGKDPDDILHLGLMAWDEIKGE